MLQKLKMRRNDIYANPIWLHVVVVLILLFLILPVLIVIPMSFTGAEYLQFPPQSLGLKWYIKFFHNTAWLQGVKNSLIIAAEATVIELIFGVLAAIGITNKHMNKTLGNVFNYIILIPMMLPAIIVAISSFMVLGQWGLVGTRFGVAIIHACMGIPQKVILLSASLYGLNPQIYDAARSLGASHWEATKRITIPLIKPAIFTSILFSFVGSFDESVVANFLAKGDSTTLPRLIFSALKYELSPEIASVSSMMIALTVIVFIIKGILSKNKYDGPTNLYR